MQKFALPGILDWMKFMRSVGLILLVLGVPPDEPTSFPMSRRFASMFAFSIFLTISIQDEAGHFLISSFVSDMSDQLQSVVGQLQEDKGDAIKMSGAASLVFRFLKFFIAVSMANEAL